MSASTHFTRMSGYQVLYRKVLGILLTHLTNRETHSHCEQFIIVVSLGRMNSHDCCDPLEDVCFSVRKHLSGQMSLATSGARGENLGNLGRVAIFSRSVPSRGSGMFTRNWYTTLDPAGYSSSARGRREKSPSV